MGPHALGLLPPRWVHPLAPHGRRCLDYWHSPAAGAHWQLELCHTPYVHVYSLDLPRSGMLAMFVACAVVASIAIGETPSASSSSAVDLSGIWTGSPTSGATQVVLAMKSGGGYGTLMDNHGGVVTEPGTTYSMLCRTSDYRTSAKCGWQSALCTVAGATGTVTCDVKPAGKISGPVNAAGDFIGFNGGPWSKFTGGLTGIWASANDHDMDAYFMLHNATTNAVQAWWDFGVTPQTADGWKWKSGVFTPANHSLFFSLNLHDKGTSNTSIISADLSRVVSGDLAGWAKKKSQVIRPSDPKSKIHTVHMIFANHLDVGFANHVNTIDNECVLCPLAG